MAEQLGSEVVADEEHVKILRQGVQVWNAWRNANPALRPDLVEANLRDADLNHANLRGANLGGADLSKADLRESDLHSANLFSAGINELLTSHPSPRARGRDIGCPAAARR
jgi:hypothetical protein